MEQYDYIDDLCKFLDSSPVNFLAVDTVRRRLDAEGFERLDPREAWEINRGGRYYVTKTTPQYSLSLSATLIRRTASVSSRLTATHPASA